MAGEQASDTSESGTSNGPPDLAEALDHLLEPVAVVSLHAHPRKRRSAPASPLRNAAPPKLPRELCRITCWRGYVKSQFVAISDREGKPAALFASPFFRSRGGAPTPDDARARAAHEALRETLAREGWELVSRGDAWYETTFSRRPTG